MPRCFYVAHPDSAFFAKDGQLYQKPQLTCCEQVVEVRAGEVVCTAENDAVLDGLLTVIHSERESDGMSNSQVSTLSTPS